MLFISDNFRQTRLLVVITHYQITTRLSAKALLALPVTELGHVLPQIWMTSKNFLFSGHFRAAQSLLK